MLKFVVKSVTKQDDNLTVVVVEPVKQSLFLEDEIPPGCIQHIISSLMENRDSKEDSIRLCDILSNIYMEDDSSRKYLIFISFPCPCLFHFFQIQFQLTAGKCSEDMMESIYSVNFLKNIEI